jgi:hypothetical protein
MVRSMTKEVVPRLTQGQAIVVSRLIVNLNMVGGIGEAIMGGYRVFIRKDFVIVEPYPLAASAEIYVARTHEFLKDYNITLPTY